MSIFNNYYLSICFNFSSPEHYKIISLFQISLANLPKLKLFYPALKAMFAEYQDEIENRAIRRNLKQEVKRKASLESKS
jgi:hypothetical protein